MQRKTALIRNLESETFVRLAPSKIRGAGVGVIAVREIPKGTDPFKKATQSYQQVVPLHEDELRNVPPSVKRMISDFNHPEHTERGLVYTLPASGLNTLDVSFYLNHSDTPNIEIYRKPGDPYLAFRAKRKIRKGEELFINYNDYSKQ